VIRDAQATRERILAAAIDEFAQNGLAGARVDAIAARAPANKRSIYVYFGNKEQLFETAFAAVVACVTEAVPLTENDLPGYAGRLFDYHLAHPELLRIAMWRQLERPGAGPDASEVYAQKLGAMSGASVGGLAPLDVLVLVIGLAQSWLLTTGDLIAAEGGDPASRARLAQHRRAVVLAAERIVSQSPS
jgi:AcrR family transcriptional regulator